MDASDARQTNLNESPLRTTTRRATPARLCWLARVAIAALDACVGIAALDAAPNPKA